MASLDVSRERWYPFAALLLLLAVWQATALWATSPLLPTPVHVLQVFVAEVTSGSLLYHLGVTMARLSVSFVVAMTLGATIGVMLGRYRRLDHFFDLWLMLFLNIPALVTIILCYVWLGLGEVAAITAVVLNKIPNVVVTLREGTRALDSDLLEMARAYRFGGWKTLRHVIWPQLLPFVMAASRTGLALIWKIILVVELLGRSNGMGYQLQLFFQMFDVSAILAYTFAFILVVQALELLVFKPLDQRSRRWRR
jgi:NitT/TauT family transport system permease protein